MYSPSALSNSDGNHGNFSSLEQTWQVSHSRNVRTCLPQEQSLEFKVSPDSTMTNHSFISSFLEIFLNMKRRVIFQNRSVGQDKCSLKANKF